MLTSATQSKVDHRQNETDGGPEVASCVSEVSMQVRCAEGHRSGSARTSIRIRTQTFVRMFTT